MRRDALDLGPIPPGNQAGGPFDLVFLDPPYGRDLVPKTIEGARAGGWLAPGAVIVAEMELAAVLPAIDGVTLVQMRDYGETKAAFMVA
jgi:16S rRNA (guanine966-N2)-methyltransferase